VPEIDAVLISHPDLAHLGALPYLVGKLGLKAPIYATIPVYKMGLMFMYDAFEAKKKDEDFDLWDLDDVDAAFDNVTQLKYSQHFKIATDQADGASIFITPYAAGTYLSLRSTLFNNCLPRALDWWNSVEDSQRN